MNLVPSYVTLLFSAATLFALYTLFRATHRSRVVLYGSLAWIVLQGLLTGTGFYLETDSLPPRFILLPVPPMIFIIVLFATKKGRRFLDGLDQKWLTLLHVVRIPVELVLFWLFVGGLVPKVMTFEGRNFDVLSGISAVFVYYFTFVNQKAGRKVLLGWNVVCLLLLINIVITAVLAAPTPFQQLAFDRPNVGVLHFPFTWLPGFIVPAVLLAHLACIRGLFRRRVANQSAAVN